MVVVREMQPFHWRHRGVVLHQRHLRRDRCCSDCLSPARPPETPPWQCRTHCLPRETLFSPSVLSFPVCICFVPPICMARRSGEKNVFAGSAWHPLFPCLAHRSLSDPPSGLGWPRWPWLISTCFPPGEAEYLLIFLQVLIWSFPNRFILFPARIFNFLRSAFGNYLC